MTSSIPSFDSTIDLEVLLYVDEGRYPPPWGGVYKDRVGNPIKKDNRIKSLVEHIKMLHKLEGVDRGQPPSMTTQGCLQMLMGDQIDKLNKFCEEQNTLSITSHQDIKEIQEEIKEKKLRDLLQEENLLLQVGKTTEIENRIKCIEEQQKVYITKFEQALKERKTQEQLEEEYVLSNVIDKTEIQNRINCIEEQQKDFIRTIYTLKVIIFGLICVFCLYTSNGYWKENNTQTCKYLLE
jgi:hypothetical protein